MDITIYMVTVGEAERFDDTNSTKFLGLQARRRSA
jgi:hypothetical protein